MLRRGLRELLDRECDARRVRAIAYDGDGRDPALWQSLADAGWAGIAVAEEFGGAGLRFEDVCIVLEEAGRAALPLPLTTTVLASRLFRRAGEAPRDSFPSRIAKGEISVTLALSQYSSGLVAAKRDAGGSDNWLLSGVYKYVPHGALVNAAVVEADLENNGGTGLFIILTDAFGLRWQDASLMDQTVPHYEVMLDNVFVLASAHIAEGSGASRSVRQFIAEWTVALAAESLGACERMLEMSIAYAKERVQFGRPIGANQAVKNRLADMGAAIERMRAAVYHAAVKIDANAEDRELAVAMAKVATGEAAAWVASQAIHVHGGVGFTWEHDLHLYFKRVKSNELFLGDDSAHLARVADAVL